MYIYLLFHDIGSTFWCNLAHPLLHGEGIPCHLHKSRSALIQISWGDTPQGNSSRAWQGRSHISREGVSPVPLQPGTRGILLWGGQHAPIHTYAWGILIVDHGILPWSSFEVVSQFLVPSAESSLSVRSYLISWTITFVCHFVSDFINR